MGPEACCNAPGLGFPFWPSRRKLPRLQAGTLSCSRTSLARNRWRDSLVQCVACLPSLIHCSAVPRLLWKRTTERLGKLMLVTMNPDRGNNSPW